ncbi:MAG: hypothetical protein Q8867_07605, partial [Bacteroidota bacterium]|nr:hypothetical protein [Bacteroidota bacterium]
YTYFYRKEDPNGSWVSMDFNFKKKITAQLPTNLVSPQELDYRLMLICAPAEAVSNRNFDSLFVPYRCVVSDIDSSHAIVLDKGSLGNSIRGSMSIPFVYTPMQINGKLVFDGGMYNNFPCDVAKNIYHADVIIGSRVAERYGKPERDDPVSQLLIMLMGHQQDTIPYSNSVLITPKIPKFNMLDFSHFKALSDSGYKEAMIAMPRLKALIHRTCDTVTLNARRKAFKAKEPPIVFDSILITGLTKPQQVFIRRQLKHGHSTISSKELESQYFRLMDEGFIKFIYPTAWYNPVTGHYDLHLDIQKTEDFNLQFGGNLSIATTNEAFLQLKYKLLLAKPIRFKINGYFGRFYNSIQLAQRVDFNSRIPWYLYGAYTINSFNYFKNSIYFFDDKTPSYIIDREYFGDGRIGVSVTNKGKLYFQGIYAYTKSSYYQGNTFSRTDTADLTGFTFFSPRLNFEMNSMNRKQFASAGSRFLISLGYISGREGFLPGSMSNETNRKEIVNYHNWYQLHASYDNYFQTIGPIKLGIYLEGMVSDQPLFSNYTSTVIFAPSFEPIPEMQTLFMPAFRAQDYIAGGLKTIVTIVKKLEFRAEGYVFQPYQAILKSESGNQAVLGTKFADRAYIAGGTLTYNAFLGPLSISLNYYDKAENPWSVNLNFGYILFNNKSLH